MTTATPNVDRAHAYAADVLAGTVPACKWVRAACQRHVDDMARAAKGWEFRFDAAKAERVCRFVQMLPHVKGKWARRAPRSRTAPKIRLEPWQCFVVASLFGWVDARGMRRYRKASLYIPRKNAKSTLAAALGWWFFAKDDEPGSEVYSGATSEKQALEVYKAAWQMGKICPELPAQLGVTLTGKTDPGPMFRLTDASKFEPLIGKPGDGASPHCAIVDEYHEHADSTLHDTMETGMGAREQPLMLIISTAGDNLSGPCRDDWHNCEKLLGGVYRDERHFAVIWTIDEGDDWTTEAALRKANPNYDVSVGGDFLLDQLEKAKRDPRAQGVFKTKHLNLWVRAVAGWLNMESWKKCADPKLSIESFAGRECWVGLDAASKVDMTSLVAAFRHGDGTAIFANHYLPEDTVNLPQHAQYRRWRDAGFLTVTPGARINFQYIEDDLRAWSESFRVQELAFDPKELNDFVNRVSVWAGFRLVEVVQSAAAMSEPMKEMEAQIAATTLRHEGDEVLTWMASNVIRKELRGGGPVKYYYPTKARPENKIDGMVAAIMALGRANLAKKTQLSPGFF